MRVSLILVAGWLACAAGSALAAEGPAVIRNEFLEVRCDRATGRVSLMALPSKRVFVKDAKLSGDGEQVTSRVATSYDGEGERHRDRHPMANGDIVVFPSCRSPCSVPT